MPKPTQHVTNKRRNAQQQLLTFESSLAYKNNSVFTSRTDRRMFNISESLVGPTTYDAPAAIDKVKYRQDFHR